MRAPALGGVPNTRHRTASRVGSPSQRTPPQKSAGVIHTQGEDDRRNKKREAPGQWILSGEPELEPYTRCHGNSSSYIRQDLTPREQNPQDQSRSRSRMAQGASRGLVPRRLDSLPPSTGVWRSHLAAVLALFVLLKSGRETPGPIKP